MTQMKLFVDALKDTHKVFSYSGRGMYGRSCLAVEVERGESPVKMMVEVSINLLERVENKDLHLGEVLSLFEALRYEDVRTDNLGLDSVIYWPEIPYEGEDSDEESESHSESFDTGRGHG